MKRNRIFFFLNFFHSPPRSPKWRRSAISCSFFLNVFLFFVCISSILLIRWLVLWSRPHRLIDRVDFLGFFFYFLCIFFCKSSATNDLGRFLFIGSTFDSLFFKDLNEFQWPLIALGLIFESFFLIKKNIFQCLLFSHLIASFLVFFFKTTFDCFSSGSLLFCFCCVSQCFFYRHCIFLCVCVTEGKRNDFSLRAM